jgi:hypothetical protein
MYDYYIYYLSTYLTRDCLKPLEKYVWSIPSSIYVDIEPREDPSIPYTDLFVKSEEIDCIQQYLGRIISIEVLYKSIPIKLRIVAKPIQNQ